MGHSDWTICSPRNIQDTCNISLFLHPVKRAAQNWPQKGMRQMSVLWSAYFFPMVPWNPHKMSRFPRRSVYAAPGRQSDKETKYYSALFTEPFWRNTHFRVCSWMWGIQIGPFAVHETNFFKIDLHFLTIHMQHVPFPASSEKDWRMRRSRRICSPHIRILECRDWQTRIRISNYSNIRWTL